MVTRKPLNVHKLGVLRAEEGDPSCCGFKGHGPLMDHCSSALFCSSPCTRSSAGENEEADAVQTALIFHENINYVL